MNDISQESFLNLMDLLDHDISQFLFFAEQGIANHIERSEEHTSELQSRPHLVCRLLLEKKKKNRNIKRKFTTANIIVSLSANVPKSRTREMKPNKYTHGLIAILHTIFPCCRTTRKSRAC